MRLVVAAFWVENDHDVPATIWEVLRDALPVCQGQTGIRVIEGSGAVVDFTPAQAEQPGLRAALERFRLEEAAWWQP